MTTLTPRIRDLDVPQRVTSANETLPKEIHIDELPGQGGSGFVSSMNAPGVEGESAFRKVVEAYLTSIGFTRMNDAHLAELLSTLQSQRAESSADLFTWSGETLQRRSDLIAHLPWAINPWQTTGGPGAQAAFGDYTHFLSTLLRQDSAFGSAYLSTASSLGTERDLRGVSEELEELRDALVENGEGLEIDAESRSQVFSFLRAHRTVPDPDIGVEKDGTLGLSWLLKPHGMIYAIFMGEERVRFSVSILAPEEEDREWISGLVLSEDKFAAILECYRQQWR